MALNLSLNLVARACGADPSLLSRWQAGMSPTIRNFQKHHGLMTAELDRCEREMFWRMARRLLDAETLAALRAAIRHQIPEPSTPDTRHLTPDPRLLAPDPEAAE
ncbi:MAG TPA: hypothetical protein VGB90_09630 [Alphaproteobacteria bacterium]